VLEYAIAELFEDGAIQRYIRRVRREYRDRRDTLVAALREQLADHVTFDVPAGGIALWIKARKGLDVDAWARSARERGAIIVTAAKYTIDGRAQPFVRLGFASLNAKELEEGVRRLAATVPR
jgi:GntR family transcriptional regulator/MocR family aminotransferase